MKLQDVLSLISSGEGQRTEFKESFAEEDDAVMALCAFSNSEGGAVLFGVSDDGRLKDLSLGRNTLEQFARKTRECVEPPLTVSIERFSVGGKNVVSASVQGTPAAIVTFAFGRAFLRVSKTNQLMSPNEIRERFFSSFKAENLAGTDNTRPSPRNESWNEREARRCGIYRSNRGLFLVHSWIPSGTPGQTADVVISLAQHGEGPLTTGQVKSVEYHLGPKFFDHTVVKSDASDQFRLEVSAYAPMLCLACVNFDDGSPPIELERYVDFWSASNTDSWAWEKTENTIRSILRILAYLDQHTDMKDEVPWGGTVKNEVEGCVAESLYDLTKLLSKALDAAHSWTPNDRDVLLTLRERGLEQLVEQYLERRNRYTDYLNQSGQSG